MAFVTPVVEHWVEREIHMVVYHMASYTRGGQISIFFSRPTFSMAKL